MSKLNVTAAAVAAVFLLVLSGCYSAPVMPPSGFIYTNLDGPISLGGSDSGSKRGESSSKALLGLFAWGDASSDGAMKDGRINTLKRLDYEFFNFLGIYQRFTTVAHGD